MTNNDETFYENQKSICPVRRCEAFVETKWELSRKRTLARQNSCRDESYDESFGFVKSDDLATIDDHIMLTEPEIILESESEPKAKKRCVSANT